MSAIAKGSTFKDHIRPNDRPRFPFGRPHLGRTHEQQQKQHSNWTRTTTNSHLVSTFCAESEVKHIPCGE